jgi:hypothetical protein
MQDEVRRGVRIPDPVLLAKYIPASGLDGSQKTQASNLLISASGRSMLSPEEVGAINTIKSQIANEAYIPYKNYGLSDYAGYSGYTQASFGEGAEDEAAAITRYSQVKPSKYKNPTLALSNPYARSANVYADSLRRTGKLTSSNLAKQNRDENYKLSVNRAMNPLKALAANWQDSLKAMAGIDNNFAFDGKYFHTDGDGKPLNKQLVKSITRGINAKAITAASPSEVLSLRYHAITAKLLLALNNSNKYVTSLTKLYNLINGNNAIAIKKAALKYQTSVINQLNRRDTKINTTVSPSSIVARDLAIAGVKIETADVNRVKQAKDDAKAIKNAAIEARYGVTADVYAYQNKLRNAEISDLTKRSYIDHIMADPSWNIIDLSGEVHNPKWV